MGEDEVEASVREVSQGTGGALVFCSSTADRLKQLSIKLHSDRLQIVALATYPLGRKIIGDVDGACASLEAQLKASEDIEAQIDRVLIALLVVFWFVNAPRMHKRH